MDHEFTNYLVLVDFLLLHLHTLAINDYRNVCGLTEIFLLLFMFTISIHSINLLRCTTTSFLTANLYINTVAYCV